MNLEASNNPGRAHGTAVPNVPIELDVNQSTSTLGQSRYFEGPQANTLCLKAPSARATTGLYPLAPKPCPGTIDRFHNLHALGIRQPKSTANLPILRVSTQPTEAGIGFDIGAHRLLPSAANSKIRHPRSNPIFQCRQAGRILAHQVPARQHANNVDQVCLHQATQPVSQQALPIFSIVACRCAWGNQALACTNGHI